MADETNVVQVTGLVEQALTLDYDALAALPEQIADVSKLAEERQGGAVTLASVIGKAGATDEARYITLFAEGDYSASVPLDSVLDQAILIYQLEGAPLPTEMGGPVRFFIPDVAACQTADVDTCANVKYVRRIELSAEPGVDSRPKNVNQHVELHRD
jgi:DMSO/TMAO reductase YedYZ molybdopterin-dependent catalytic subunit